MGTPRIKTNKPRQHFPKKGTKIRKMALLMLRPEGLSSKEAMGKCLIKDQGGMRSTLDYLTDGYKFNIVSKGITGMLSKITIQHHYITGRHRSDGKYLDYINKTIERR